MARYKDFHGVRKSMAWDQRYSFCAQRGSSVNVRGVGVRIGTCAGSLVLALLAGAGPVSADTGAYPGKFASQAKEAGLSPEEAAALQARVDEYLKKSGGVQTAINKVQYDGSELLLPLPGEQRARDLTKSASEAAADPYGCPHLYFCVYTGTSDTGNPYTGDMRKYFKCGEKNALPPWLGKGSYYNNQSSGLRATFYRYGQVYHSASCAAVCSVPNNPNWTEIFWVQPC